MQKITLPKLKTAFTSCLILCYFIANSQCPQDNEFSKVTPKRDLRGVFLPTVFNLTWPTTKGNTLATQQAQQNELITILDHLKTNNYNTVFLQVRPASDALYVSAIEPWSNYLTGTEGTAPNPVWDPLTFAINESHKRGLDLHAWINPYRAKNGTYANASNHPIIKNPSWVFTAANNANLKILNPGIPQVRDYIVSIVQDIATRYDVDGIHFDDYFYPSGAMTAAPNNQDNQAYIDNNPAALSLGDWRRENGNKMITMVYDAIQAINTNLNKNIVFGVSPTGIWKSGTPTGISGNSTYNDLFYDPIAWLNAGKVDYLAPQLYWKITGAQDYVSLSQWWNDQVKAKNKQLYVSQAYYKMDDSNNWLSAELQNQTIQNRAASMNATFGQIAYSYTSIKNNSKSINTNLLAAEYKYKSFAPPITSKDAICPNPPTNIKITGTTLSWDTPAAAADGDLPSKYVIYAFSNTAEAVTNKDDGSRIIEITAGNQYTLTQNQVDTKFIVVTSLDKNNNEAGTYSPNLGNDDFELRTNQLFSVYPNPFSDVFTIELNNASFNKARITIFDPSGIQVWQQDFESRLDSKILVQPTNVESGIYFVRINFENGSSESFKIIKK
ncbi:family 10 glycosylhydrolase [Flavobacterium geliluteum]|uniref:Family 10 glycosylhydrolase n=1 Tax=Flavobacterium geliluteum TaxID=2816120 RepID=A0A940XGJ4_9FLAO|nr:family 10 glycosylhydrolase [Flavobacterium geliluteum]MBP4139349.1 family 10 glycosylhydrolase [Flavobacterium geliluteum]